MRVTRGLLLALGIPAFFILTGISTLADTSPSPSGGSTASGATALPGDPTKGATLYAQNCATCHGASLEGGIGAVLNSIEKLSGLSNPLDPNFLVEIIANGSQTQGGYPEQTPMAAKGGNNTVPHQCGH